MHANSLGGFCDAEECQRASVLSVGLSQSSMQKTWPGPSSVIHKPEQMLADYKHLHCEQRGCCQAMCIACPVDFSCAFGLRYMQVTHL